MTDQNFDPQTDASPLDKNQLDETQKNPEKNPENFSNDELEKKRDELQANAANLDEHSDENSDENPEKKSDDPRDAEIARLQRELQEITDRAAKAQRDYLSLKQDFDRILKNAETERRRSHEENLLKISQKFLPVVEDLRKSLAALSDDQRQSPLGQTLAMIHTRALKNLENLKIFPIPDAIGETPDTTLHEPIGTTDAPDLAGKIAQELEKWFTVTLDDQTKVITTSKVLIGQ